MKKFSILFGFGIILCFHLTVSAQQKSFTTSRTSSPPKIDGVLDDNVWQLAEWTGDYRQSSPNDGASPSQRTEMKVLYDDDNIYVAFKAYDTEPDQIKKLLSRRDSFPGDWVEINIDSNGDKRTAFSFTVSVSGVKGEEFISEDGNNWDTNWNPVWEAKSALTDYGWSAEMRIPLGQIRFSGEENQTWGIQSTRRLFRKEERSLWQYKAGDEPGWVSRFGEMHGIQNLQPKRRIEVLPYSVAKYSTSLKEAGNPFSDDRENTFNGGFDAKVGITNDFNLDISVNPDFGQVEADPSEVNLSAFETFFPEKRQFFIEGNNILRFNMSGSNLFHSRRIGRRPGHFPSTGDGEYADAPDNTSILAALKLAGKTKNGFSIGILESITENEKADFFSNGRTSRVGVEPLTNYFVGRVQKDFDEGNMIVGTMFTATNRKIDESQLEFMNDAAYTGGVDIRKFWKNKTYDFNFLGSFSHVRGSTEAIERVQKSSSRYFQRPDADYLTFDPTRTSLSGSGGTMSLAKTGGGHWRFGTFFEWKSPGWELNDIGFLGQTDLLGQDTWLGYNVWKPTWIFNNFNLNVTRAHNWNYNNDRIRHTNSINFHGQLRNFWFLNANISHDSDILNQSVLRGGPAFVFPGQTHFNFGGSTDQRKDLSFNYNTNHSVADFNTSRRFGGGISLRVKNNFNLNFNPSYRKSENELQYVTTKDFQSDNRYIMGSIDQKTFSLTTRFNLTITPNLSVQYYGEPFFSAGSYSNFKYVTAARAGNYSDRFSLYGTHQIAADGDSYNVDENGDAATDYSFGKPDFNVFQFNSNLVVRWEYSPGSTVFFVWTQDRSGFENRGRYSFNDDFRDVFSFHPNNIFLIKFNRWLSF